MAMPRMRLLALIGALVALPLVLTTVGSAYFKIGSATGGNGRAVATSVAQANAPTAVLNAGRSVTVSWGASTLANGGAVDGYLVTRYDASTDAPQIGGVGCQGQIAATSCT